MLSGHQSKTGFAGYCRETDWCGVWYDVVDNSTTGLRQGRVRIRTNIRPFLRWKTWSFTSRLLRILWSRICGAGRCLMAVPKHFAFLRCLWMVKTKWVR